MKTDSTTIVLWAVVAIAAIFAVFWLAGVRPGTDEATEPTTVEPVKAKSIIGDTIGYDISGAEDNAVVAKERKPPPPPLEDEFDPAPGEDDLSDAPLL